MARRWIGPAMVAALGAGVIGFGHLASGCGGSDPPPTVRTTVKWEFNTDLARGFDGDNCTDLHVDKVRVELAGPSPQSTDAQCSERQAVFLDLMAGDYTATVTPLDINGVVMVTTPGVAPVPASDTSSEVTVVIPYTSWTQQYTGTFQFRLKWGGQPCASALPPVMTQVLTLMIGGVAVTQLTDTGQHLDGSDPEACRASTDQFPQRVLALPMGPAVIIVEGRDATGTPQYAKQWDTFVGAGTSNSEMVFDSPGPDAAPPDAAPPDASPIDAM